MDMFLGFLQTLKEHGLEYFKRYYSMYPAIVVDIDDPDQRGRIKVKVPTLFGPDLILANWAEPADFKMAGKGVGEFMPPYKDEWVSVMFEHGDTQHPMYIGGVYAKSDLPSDFKSSYGNVRGFVFKSGQKIIFDESQGKEIIKLINTDGSQLVFDGSAKTASFQHSSGAGVNIDQSGGVTVSDGSGNESMVLKDGSAKIETSGQAEFAGQAQTTVGSASGITKVQGSMVQLGQGGSPVALAFVSQIIGIGNLGLPITGQVINGSVLVTSS